MGAQMVGEVASKTSAVAGDGTITATMLAQATVREGMKFVADGMNPTGLKRGIDKAVTATVDELRKTSRLCATNKEISQVGASPPTPLPLSAKSLRVPWKKPARKAQS